MMNEERADVVVIGGGIVGCSVAYYLAKRNVDVTLVEKGEIGFEQSSRAWGFVRQQGRDPSEVPLMVEANKIWSNLSSELDADIEWVKAGNLAIANDEARLEMMRGWLPVAKEFGLETRIVDREGIKGLIPGIEGAFIGGMFTPNDGHAEPSKATDAINQGAIKAGAKVHTYRAVEGIELSSGRVSAVMTDKGTIRTPVVVCAAGGSSSKIGRMVGLNLPQLQVRATVAETTAVPPVTPIGVWEPGVAFRQRPTGNFYLARGAISDYDVTLDSFRNMRLFLPNYLKNRNLFRIRVGKPLVQDALRQLPGSRARRHPFAHTVDVEPEPNTTTAFRSLAGLKRLFPSLPEIGIKRVFAGLIDSTPDAIPVIGEVGSPQGFIFATGFSGHGFAMGPIVGRLLSELIVDGQMSLDISGMRFSRFKEGAVGRPRNVL